MAILTGCTLLLLGAVVGLPTAVLLAAMLVWSAGLLATATGGLLAARSPDTTLGLAAWHGSLRARAWLRIPGPRR